MFSTASLRHKPLAQGFIAKTINNIPNNILMRELKFSSILIIPTEKIIIGILNIITITLPNRKFLWFIRFIEEEIEPKQDRINEPIEKLTKMYVILSLPIFNKIHAMGIDNKKGNWTNKKCEKVFKIAINP